MARMSGEDGRLRTDARRDRRELCHVESVDARGVESEHRAGFATRYVLEGVAQPLPGVRPGAFGVRIVGTPHDLVDADRRAHLDLVRVGERSAQPALAREVLAGAQ